MKYKVGDKVRVKENLPLYIKDHCVSTFSPETLKYNGMIVTVSEAKKDQYKIEEDKGFYDWYEDMFEPVEEMSTEEAIKLSGKMCSSSACYECPVFKSREKYGEMCNVFKKEHAEEYLEILKQWKADHEKKPIEMENVIYIVVLDEKRNVVYEEKTNGVVVTTDMKEEVLKKYCSEHDGKYYAISERRCVVKE